jgi:ABC-2 type transport system ATP-binding protein
MTRWDATSRAGELLELVGLSGAVGRRVGTYSGGMRRRLDLALALVHRPEILFLDEPTTGLDPTSRRALWGEVKRLNRDFGITVFLTTQYLEEADELADVVAIIDKGRIATMGAPAELKAGVGPESVNVTFDSREKAGKARSELAGIAQRTQVDDDTVRLYMARAAASVPGVVNRLQGAGIEADSISLTQPTLGDVFLQVTGQRLRVQEDAPAEPA